MTLPGFTGTTSGNGHSPCQAGTLPDDSWSLERLAEYISAQHISFQGLARKTAVHQRRLGHALSLAYVQIKANSGSFKQFLAEHSISVTTAWRARKLYESTSSEEELDELSISQAYVQAGMATKSTGGEDGDPSDSSVADELPGKADSDETDTASDESDADTEANDSDAPSKEDLDSFGRRLAQWVERAAWLAEIAWSVEPEKGDLEVWLPLLQEAKSSCIQIVAVLSNVGN